MNALHPVPDRLARFEREAGLVDAFNLRTVGYTSPDLARGQAVDKRANISLIVRWQVPERKVKLELSVV